MLLILGQLLKHAGLISDLHNESANSSQKLKRAITNLQLTPFLSSLSRYSIYELTKLIDNK